MSSHSVYKSEMVCHLPHNTVQDAYQILYTFTITFSKIDSQIKIKFNHDKVMMIRSSKYMDTNFLWFFNDRVGLLRCQADIVEFFVFRLPHHSQSINQSIIRHNKIIQI